MSLKKVAICGAGPAGLVSAKYALENGLLPVVFDKSKFIGGLWSSDSTAAWDGLYSNASFYTEMFSDFSFPKETPIFPSRNDINKYLLNYAKHFDLNKCISLNKKIEKIRKVDKKWEVNSMDTQTSKTKSDLFDYVMLANGLHSKPRVPNIKNSENFQGLQIHSSKFILNDPRLKDKNVIVVGCSISGAEITASLVGHAKRVVNIFQRPYLMVPRLVRYKIDSKSYGILPCDMFFYRRSFTYAKEGQSSAETRSQKIDQLKKLFPEQTNKDISHPDLFFDLNNPNQELLVAVSDYYYPYVKQNKIIPKKTSIKQFSSRGVLLEDGTFENADAVVYCTGYEVDLGFLDDLVLKDVGFDTSKNYKHALMLYKCTFHPDYENMAMIGQQDGLFFAGYELQAKWSTGVFSGKLKLPDKNVMSDLIEKEKRKRNGGKRAQYPYGPYVGILDGLASEMDALPDLNQLKTEDSKLYDMFSNNCLVSTQFVYKQNKELALSVMNDIDSLYKKSYEFDGMSEDSIGIKDVANQFGKYYKLPDELFKF